MITYHRGDLWESRAINTVITVNCVGAPGKGLALEWAKRAPKSYIAMYKENCASGEFKPGRVMKTGPYLLMATKDHWREPSQLKWVENGLRTLAAYCYRGGESLTVAMGKPGCGLGGLSWDQVGPLVRTYLGDLECDVMVYIGEGDEEY